MTEQERFEICGERLTEFRAKQATAQKRCDELNKDKDKLNRIGGVGYHVIYGRCVCNPALGLTFAEPMSAAKSS